MKKLELWKNYILIQFLVMLYSWVGVLSKTASNYLAKEGFFSPMFIILLGGMVLILGVYAVFWQKILKKFELSVAYLNKAFGLFWSLLWSVLFFNEQVRGTQFVGIIIIVCGIVLVTNYDK